MAKLTKKQKALVGKVESTKLYALTEALDLVKSLATAKFDESIDVAVQLGIDAKKSDQVVRGAVVLPNGTGKTKRVAVFAQGAKAEEAKAAGADVVGMSTVPEVIVAVHGGMRVLGLSIITDQCLPDALVPATLEQIMAVAAKAEPVLTTLVTGVLEKLPA